MEEEALTKIDEAYKDGYKQGLLEYAPDNEKLMFEKARLEIELEEEKSKNMFNVSFWSIPISFLIGLISGFIGSLIVIVL